MKVIFLRGLPGTGKTLVTELLKKELSNAEIVTVDNFKLEAMKNGQNFNEAKNFAYEQALRKLYEFYLMKKDYVLVDELICEEKFLKMLYVFLTQTESSSYWFRLLRPLNKLIEVESGRNRKIKNSLEDFNKLKRDIESLKIKGEYWIKNDNLTYTVNRILKLLK